MLVSEIDPTATSRSASVPSPVSTGAGGTIDAPAVVAIVVACNPDEHFTETLASLGRQDYENLSVLVVDAGSDAPIADRVAEVLPEAYLHRLAGDPGFSVAANQSIELVSGSPFLLFCHDDVALEPDCVSQLMGALYRNNGGIAGPKLVKWDDDRQFLQLGMGSDRFGVMVEQVEPGEFDQDQYDSVRDVFVIPGGVQLIRADLFAALGGFDPAIKVMGEDLDLCWRAHAAGARVLAVPAAKARHRENMESRISIRERRRLLTRHRLRTVLATASRRSVFVVLGAFALIVLESLYSLIAGRRGQARDVLSAIGWNLSRVDDLRRKRRQLAKTRSVSDSKIAKLQSGGSARIAAFSRGQFSAGQDRFSGMVGTVRGSFRGEDAGSVRDATVIGGILAVLLVFGSRHLLTRGVVPVGQIPDVPTATILIREWLGGWRTVGTGGPGNAPTALPILAVGRLLFFWSGGLFQTLLVVAPVFFGPIGAYRLARPLGSARAGGVAAIVYAGSPLVVSALSAARWEALILIAAAPFVLAALLRVGGYAPFGADGGLPGPSVADRNLSVRLIRFGFVVAFLAAFAPATVPIAVLAALSLALAALALGAGGAPQHYLGAAVVAVVAPVALHGPWSFDLLQGLSWRWLIGPDSPEAGVNSMLDLLQFAPGAPAPRLIALGLVIAAVVGLVTAKAHQFHLAAMGWLLAIVFLGTTWAGRRGWVPVDLPTAEAMLAMTAAGLTLAVIVGVRALEINFTDRAVSLLQTRATAFVGGTAVAAMLLTGLFSALDGRWDTPTQSFTTSTQFMVRQQQTEANSEISTGRVLWIGDDSVLPLDVAVSVGGTQYAVSDGGRAEARGRWLASPVGATDGIGAQLDLASNGEVVRLGRLLAPYGIDNVVVVTQLAPAPYTGPSVDPGNGILQALSQQLDLERVPGVPNLVVFRNTSSNGVTPLLPNAAAAAASTAVEQLDIDLTNRTSRAPIVNYAPGRWVMNVPADTDVLVSLDSAGLEATGVRTELRSGFDDLAVVPAGPSGEVLIEYAPRVRRQLAIFGQILLILIGAILAQTRREIAV